MFISEQELCDILKISHHRLRIILREHSNPVYMVKRLGKRVYDEKDALKFVDIIEEERAEERVRRKLRMFRNTKAKGNKNV